MVLCYALRLKDFLTYALFLHRFFVSFYNALYPRDCPLEVPSTTEAVDDLTVIAQINVTLQTL